MSLVLCFCSKKNTDKKKQTYLSTLLLLENCGVSKVSSISTISTSPDCISLVPSHDIIKGEQSAPEEQSSGDCKKKMKKIIRLISKYSEFQFT